MMVRGCCLPQNMVAKISLKNCWIYIKQTSSKINVGSQYHHFLQYSFIMCQVCNLLKTSVNYTDLNNV